MKSALRMVTALLLALGALAPATAGAAPTGTAASCAGDPATPVSTESLFGLSGLAAFPAARPTHLVVVAHGYRKPATAYWGPHLSEIADHGALAVGVDYRGIGPAPDYRGWNVRAGARDSIAAAKYFLRRCHSLQTVILLGVSMGGNASGLAVAARPTRPGGAPLFDYWIDLEGAANVSETYAEASLVALSGNAYAVGAKEDIEREMGGTPAERPAQYRRETVVARADDIAAAGLKGVVFVHGLDDGLVPYDQSRELATALAARGVAEDFYTVLTRGSGESGTTLDGTIAGSVPPAAGYQSPFAGHGAEESETQLVIVTGLQRLWDLLAGAAPGPHREFVVDGEAGQIPPP